MKASTSLQPRFDRADFNRIVAAAKREPLLVRHLGHMRQRMDDGQLGFVLGAGASEQAGVPLWRDLIGRLFDKYGSEGPPDAYKDRSYPATLVAQFIYNRFQANLKSNLPPYDLDPRMVSIAVRNKWYREIHTAIYKDVCSIEDIISSHPYMLELAHLVYQSPFCLTLNFDDILDRVTLLIRGFHQHRQSPNVIWRPPVVDRANAGVIYHVNGFLPMNIGAKGSENIVLTEDSFASLLASPSPIETEYMMARVTSNTMLVIGASFDDPSLRNLFYAAARRNPAGFHYCLLHDKDAEDGDVNSNERIDRKDLNKSMYNMATYFVTKDEISSIIRMLSLPQALFTQNVTELAGEIQTETTYRYYVVGPVSSGKSSLVERLRNFKTYEEWGEPPLALMFKDPKSLTQEERTEVDEWVLSQLAYKDDLMRTPKYGIHIMDRAPLDMFAFSEGEDTSPEELNALKADRLTRKLNRRPVQKGEILFLRATPETLFERQVRRGRGPEWLQNAAYQQDSLNSQTEALMHIYHAADGQDTTYLSRDEVARQTAERILFDDYRPSDLESFRKSFERNGAGEC